ncbi:sporulation protein YqfD [Numidum massiliense]|uniref:sporulation protein YqfD n=1 Tax=Numidum massiliense TaxID=1522315 RepID=UPI0006D5B25C|nr:sporulation protein YqfD [Numidum massiliense]
MQQNNFVQLLRGYVMIELRQGNISALINETQTAGIAIWDIEWKKKGHAVFCLFAHDFKRFRHVVRAAGAKVTILEKHGLPFILSRVQNRSFFVIGLIACLVSLFIASNMIWSVEIHGNEAIPEKEIARLANEVGVYRGQFQFRLATNEAIQRQLTLGLSDASWVGFHVQGTKAIITVVEKKKAAEDEAKAPRGPYDLVAKRSATIVDLSEVETGRILVEYNQTVRKGERLVSGIYGSGGDDEDGGIADIVGARGAVIGETWYETTASVPLVQTHKVYTGNRDTTHYPYIGSWPLYIPFFDDIPFDRYETIQRSKTLYIRGWKLPFGLVEEERMETEQRREQLTAREAEQLALARARDDVLAKLGPDGEIKAVKILQKEVNGGKVELKILFTVWENIAQPEPIFIQKSEDDT